MKTVLAIAIVLLVALLGFTDGRHKNKKIGFKNGRFKQKKLPKFIKEKLKKTKTASGKIEMINRGIGMIDRLFESDIMVSPEELQQLRKGKTPKRWKMNKLSKKTRLAKRNAMRNRALIWRTKRIPYSFSPEIVSAGTTQILAAINTFSTKTCVQWVPKTASDTKYIHFVKKDGCWSHVGKTSSSGAQELSVGDGCNSPSTILHEMMHGSGFYHEQSRPDRDAYVLINWANIMDGQNHNFNKQTLEDSEIFGTYDYSSLMHYQITDFSKNGSPTIQAKDDPNKVLGQDNGLTLGDIEKIKALYDCSSPSSNAWSDWSTYGPCHTDLNTGTCVKIRQRFCTVESMAGCTGSNSESASCTSCVANGQWGMWSAWGSCSMSCGSGSQQRTRACDSPAPSNGGSNCVGSTTETQACNTQSCSASALNSHSCNFEAEGSCEWNNEYNNAQDSEGLYYDWISTNAPSDNQATGPAADHTPTGEGYYFIIRAESFSSGSIGAVSRSGFNPTSAACLDFWYHMKGADMGSFKIYTKSSAGKNLIWSVSGNQGSDWLNDKLDLSSSQAFSIIFESVRGSGTASDIALDDITVTSGACSF